MQPESHARSQLQRMLKFLALWSCLGPAAPIYQDLQRVLERYSKDAEKSDSMTNVPGAQMEEHGCRTKPRLHLQILGPAPGSQERESDWLTLDRCCPQAWLAGPGLWVWAVCEGSQHPPAYPLSPDQLLVGTLLSQLAPVSLSESYCRLPRPWRFTSP